MKYAVLMISISALLAGCSASVPEYKVPVPDERPKEKQRELEAVKHWDVLAEDAAAQIHQEIIQRNLLGTTVNIKPAAALSPFSKGLHELLTTRLVNKGLNVVKDGSGKLDVDYSVNVVRFYADRKNRSESYYIPGSLTALAAGILVAHNASTLWSASGQKAAFLGLAGVGDAFESVTGPSHHESWRDVPNLEVIVNTSLMLNNSYLARRSDIYYVNNPDSHQFNSRSINIKGCDEGKVC